MQWAGKQKRKEPERFTPHWVTAEKKVGIPSLFPCRR